MSDIRYSVDVGSTKRPTDLDNRTTEGTTMARHMTFSDKIAATADRMVRDADQRAARLGELYAIRYVGASGQIRQSKPVNLSTALGYGRTFTDNGKIVGVDYFIASVNADGTDRRAPSRY